MASWSGFTPGDPPPTEPPVGVRVRTYWRGAAQWWYEHLPDPTTHWCARCGAPGPCPEWTAADRLLADALGRDLD